jgi:mRNA interferase HigB
MHIITKTRLMEFWADYPDAEGPLKEWHRIVSKTNFADFNELRATFRSADHVAPYTVFNIGGNKYRLIVKMEYRYCTAYIRAVLTHTQYDRNKWKE